MRIHLQTLVHKLHRVQEPICEHNVRVIGTYKLWACEQFVVNHLHRFFNKHKVCSQFSGYDVPLQFFGYPRCSGVTGFICEQNVRKCIHSFTVNFERENFGRNFP